MKKVFLLGSISICLLVAACNNDKKEPGTHVHDDGSTHAEHDTTKPQQQEFSVTDSSSIKDTSNKQHTHKDGEKHSH
jgi:hypothetical protein